MLYAVITIFLCVGIYNIVGYFLRFNVIDRSKAIIVQSSNNHKLLDTFKLAFYSLSNKFSGLIKINDLKRRELVNIYESIEWMVTPETHILKCIFVLILSLIASFASFMIHPFLGILLIILSVLITIKSYKEPIDLYKKHSTNVEKEILKFACMICENIKVTRNIYNIIDDYINANDSESELVKELVRTRMDMRTSSYPVALIRLSDRLNLSEMTDVVRGLLGVDRGDDQQKYFETLIERLKQEEYAKKRREVLKRPAKIKPYTVALSFLFIVIFLAVLVVSMLDEMAVVFNF